VPHVRSAAPALRRSMTRIKQNIFVMPMIWRGSQRLGAAGRGARR
jgi:hypothetical protein